MFGKRTLFDYLYSPNDEPKYDECTWISSTSLIHQLLRDFRVESTMLIPTSSCEIIDVNIIHFYVRLRKTYINHTNTRTLYKNTFFFYVKMFLFIQHCEREYFSSKASSSIIGIHSISLAANETLTVGVLNKFINRRERFNYSRGNDNTRWTIGSCRQ